FVGLAASGDEYRVAAHVVDGSNRAVVYRVSPSSLRILGQTRLNGDVADHLEVDLGFNDVAFTLQTETGRLTTFDAAGEPRLNLLLDPGGTRTDRGLAVLELAPG